MVYGTVQQHDGYIAVESAPGKGTRFRIWLPRRVAAPAASDRGLEDLPPPRGEETILVAEDETILRELAREILESSGYRVLTAGDGEEAVRLFRERPDEIQLLLLDLIMPRMSGREACDAIRKLRPSVKVLFMSGYAPEAAGPGRTAAPRGGLLSKPLSPGSLLRAVRRTLDSPPEPA